MPTYLALPRFLRDHAQLSAADKIAFRNAVVRFIEGLRSSEGMHPSLRVHRISGTTDIWSLTWASDGRATFQYGDAINPDQPHIIWRRVGTHCCRTA